MSAIFLPLFWQMFLYVVSWCLLCRFNLSRITGVGNYIDREDLSED